MLTKMSHFRLILGCVLSAGFATQAEAATRCVPPTPVQAAFYTSPVLMPGVISPHDGTCFLDDVWVTTHDGLQLEANLFLPASALVEEPADHPGVVMISSWASGEFFEYLGQQHQLAKQGVVTLAYTARGFWGSEGVVGVAGEDDVLDVSDALDTMLSAAPVDEDKLGVSGISYGAGLSLLAAAADPRIKAVAALSGWNQLIEQLFANSVGNATWVRVLTASGHLTGRLDPIVQHYADLILSPDLNSAEIAEAAAWGAARSPGSYIEALNKNRPAVLLVKNWQDHMFTPNSSMRLFSELTGPKLMLIQPGVHGAEIGAAVSGDAHPVYNTVRAWFAQWLQGEDLDLGEGSQLWMKPQFGGEYEAYDSWPSSWLRQERMYFGARGELSFDWSCFCFTGDKGSLLTEPRPAASWDRIKSGVDTTATTAIIPVLTPMSEASGTPLTLPMWTVLRDHGLRYQGWPMEWGLKLRGIPSVSLRVRPSSERGMLVAYLYSVNPQGIGTLVTHGAVAWREVTPGEPIDLELEMNAVFFDVPVGHRVELVLDTADSLYQRPNRLFDFYSVEVDASASSLNITAL